MYCSTYNSEVSSIKNFPLDSEIVPKIWKVTAMQVVVQKLPKMKATQHIMMWTVFVLTLPKKFVRLKITQLLKKSTKLCPMRAAPMSAQWKKKPHNISSAIWTHNFKLTKQQFLSFVKRQEVLKVFSLEVLYSKR